LDFGTPYGVAPPQGEKTRPGRIRIIMQNFTTIGYTVAEKSVPGPKNS